MNDPVYVVDYATPRTAADRLADREIRRRIPQSGRVRLRNGWQVETEYREIVLGLPGAFWQEGLW